MSRRPFFNREDREDLEGTPVIFEVLEVFVVQFFSWTYVAIYRSGAKVGARDARGPRTLCAQNRIRRPN